MEAAPAQRARPWPSPALAQPGFQVVARAGVGPQAHAVAAGRPGLTMVAARAQCPRVAGPTSRSAG